MRSCNEGGPRSFGRYGVQPRNLVRTLVRILLSMPISASSLRHPAEDLLFGSRLASSLVSSRRRRKPDELVKFLGAYFDDMRHDRSWSNRRGPFDHVHCAVHHCRFWVAP